MISGMRLELDGVQVRGDVWMERCATTIQAAGAYVLVVETVLPAHAAGLSSCYLSSLSGETAVSHLRRAPDATATFTQRVLAEGMAGATHARACLLDHAAELQAFLHDHGEQDVQRRDPGRSARPGRRRVACTATLTRPGDAGERRMAWVSAGGEASATVSGRAASRPGRAAAGSAERP